MSNEHQAPAVIAKLQKYAEENAGNESKTLKKTGIKATFPKLITHGMMQQAQMKARGKAGKVVDHVLAELCRFDGDKMTHDQVAKYLPAADTQQIQALIFGDAIGEAMDKLMGGDEADAG